MQKDNLKPWHPGMYYAGQTTEWMPTGLVGHDMIADKLLAMLT
jgi:hypothetical protein